MRWDDHPSHKPTPIDTDFPLLFLSNRRDPVTPLHAALKMTRKFSNASIVEQIADGHCTISCISPCTIGHIRAYMNDGILPPSPKFNSEDEGEWATCKCNEKPWKSFDASGKGHTTTERGELVPDTPNEHVLEELEIMASYHELRNHFVSQMVSQVVDEFNPLRQFIMDMPLNPTKNPQTCNEHRQDRLG